MALITNRRKLITGLISLVAAPAIVRIENIMPVKLVTAAEAAKEVEHYEWRHVIDKLTRMPTGLWIRREDYARVLAGEHPRYDLGERLKYERTAD